MKWQIMTAVTRRVLRDRIAYLPASTEVEFEAGIRMILSRVQGHLKDCKVFIAIKREERYWVLPSRRRPMGPEPLEAVAATYGIEERVGVWDFGEVLSCARLLRR